MNLLLIPQNKCRCHLNPKDDKSEQTWYTMKNQKGQELAGHLNVIFIDLLVIKKLIGTPVEKLTALQKWGLYLSYADDESKADYISQIANSEKGIMKARTIINRMSEEEENWFREFSYDKARRDYNTSMSIAKRKGLEAGLKEGRKKGMEEGRKEGLKEGRKEGLEEGRKEGRKEGSLEKTMEMASKMLSKKYSVSEISEITGLSAEQIEELKKK